MHNKTFDEWLQWCESLHPKAIDLTLDRIQKVAARLEVTRFSSPVITVAGTNGKGSCIATMEAILLAQGLQVAAYTSPHLFHYTERLRLNGQAVSEAQYCEAFEKVEKARGNVPLTYFEFGTLATLTIIQENLPDIILLEVGLGGRLDAVNIVEPDVTVITTIDLDHTEWLGTDRESIGAEKAGIFRENKPAVFGDFEVPYSILGSAHEKNVKLVCLTQDFGYTVFENSWNWWGKSLQYSELPIPKVPVQNAATAIKALHQLPEITIQESAIREGLSKVKVPGRFEIVPGKVTCIFDVGHNPHAARWLASRLKTEPCAGRTLAVFGVLADKDWRNIVDPLQSNIDEWYVASLSTSRTMKGEELARNLNNLGLVVKGFSSIRDAFLTAQENAHSDDRIIVFGSFYTVAEAYGNVV